MRAENVTLPTCKGKGLTICVDLLESGDTFALTGRQQDLYATQGVALGYVRHWAFSPLWSFAQTIR